MNSSDKYFWMYDKEDEKNKTDYTKNNKADEKKFERIRKNIAENGVSAKPQESVYNSSVPEKSAQSENYSASKGIERETNANQGNSTNNQDASKNANSKPPESLDDLLKKLNQQPNSQASPGSLPVDKIFEAVPDMLMYQAGEMWKEIKGVLRESGDKELMEKANAVAGYVLGDPKNVVHEVRNDVSGYLVYRGLNWLKQFKEKILGR